MRYALILFASAFLSGLTVRSMELPESRLQTAIREQRFALTLADEFSDSFETEDKSERSDVSSVTVGHRSVTKAALYSALLPGAGEWYVGHRTKARYFIGAELLTWVGFASFTIYSDWKEDDFVRLAADRAHAQLGNKSDEFRDLVGFYDSIDEFNTFGRVFDPDRQYLEDTPENHWFWNSEEDRRAYRDLKNRSREANRRAQFMIGVAVVNRIVSVVDAVVSARRVNSRLTIDRFSRISRHIKLKVSPFSRSRQLTISLSTGL